METHSVDITPIVNSLIALVATIITIFLIPWLKSVTTSLQRKEIAAWVDIAVGAAELLYKGSGRGDEKKQYVMAYLAEQGFKLDEESISLMVESAVLKLKKETADNIAPEVTE